MVIPPLHINRTAGIPLLREHTMERQIRFHAQSLADLLTWVTDGRIPTAEVADVLVHPIWRDICLVLDGPFTNPTPIVLRYASGQFYLVELGPKDEDPQWSSAQPLKA